MASPAAGRLLQHKLAKPLVFVAALGPFFYLAWAVFANALGSNPAEALIRATGDWTLRFLCITLAVTPLRQLTGQGQLLRFRRMLGLFTFFYGMVHVLCYSGFDMAFDIDDIGRDIIKRPFILAGFTALMLMVPLAATSFNRVIRAMGAARWQLLHRLVYAVAAVALLHFWWMRAAKHNFAEPAIYIAIISVLMAWRLWHRWRGVRASRMQPTAARNA